ncbi:hypothetical protein Tsubulata_047894 [Turnera subulata]|uniref:Uncharacterized protein n=1 Tax=Turnera subulata TaxID=218843 RepID=A0A9Q0FQX6_9ROSI|nr:hypothetical protein Tsubulata_047894 [Turnera subulata]
MAGNTGGTQYAGGGPHPWLESIKEELQVLAPLSSSSIWKVPLTLRTVNEEAYMPRMISIGPLHYGKWDLQSMEVHKLYYMSSLLQRTPNAVQVLEEAGAAIESLEPVVRASYSESFDLEPSELAKMLMLDGCFILELFLRDGLQDLRLQDDPIFNTSWMVLTLARDLALLENQIPFVVLERLFEFVVVPSAIGHSLPALPELSLSFFSSVLYMDIGDTRASRRQFPHLLGLIYNSYIPSPRTEARGNGSGRVFIRSASALKRAGIQFRKSIGTSLFDLKFHNGVLQIPPLFIHESSASVFWNLIAYEQIFHDKMQYVTSYFSLMARLVNSSDDAELLESRGILLDSLGGPRDVPQLFEQICRHVVLKDFYYAQLCEEMNPYYKWKSYRPTKPWTLISIVASFILLALVSLHAIYTVLSYYGD